MSTRVPIDRQRAEFLRSCRARINPADLGLPVPQRKRTEGLRREDVASLSGVSVSWYTWLEQGRDVQPSAEVLAAVADALRLDAAERRHLYILNDRPPPDPRPIEPERVEEPLRRMLDSLTGQPAYVLGRRWDILAWNRAAVLLFGDYEKLDGDERNIMHLVFADKAHRKLLLDWEELAQAVLAMFRADSARYAGDESFERLIAKLTTMSAEFRRWWSRHDVLVSLSGHKRIKHPIAGRLNFEYTSFAVTNQPDLKLIVYTPLTTDKTADKLDALLSGRRSRKTRSSAAHERRRTVRRAP